MTSWTAVSLSRLTCPNWQSAKTFYTEKLGFEVRFDITMGEEFEGTGAGYRWLTVGAPPASAADLAARRQSEFSTRRQCSRDEPRRGVHRRF